MEERRTFQILNLCCQTCAALIRQGLATLPGVRSVQVAVETRRVTVQWATPTTWRDIERRLDNSGYPPGPPVV